ncbi:rhombosortase [Microbulbifer sp. SAOS-129_SWC]|uniref:rhombosortase n=1 Tax=Microbulbifer sp. SAOS-129_SWC TaxID=3145235 RepID=UPI0032178C0E
MIEITTGRRRCGLLGPLVLFIAIAACWWWSARLQGPLIYDRALIAQGQWWRLLSGHLTHSGTAHFLLNSAGLALLWVLHRSHYRPANFFGVVALIALGCGLGLYWFSPATQLYLGLSGVLHGLVIWGGYRDIASGWRTGYLLVAGTWAKVAWEQLVGASDATARLIGVPVATDAHLWGAATGSLLCLGLLAHQRLSTGSSDQRAPERA